MEAELSRDKDPKGEEGPEGGAATPHAPWGSLQCPRSVDLEVRHQQGAMACLWRLPRRRGVSGCLRQSRGLPGRVFQGPALIYSASLSFLAFLMLLIS